MFIRVHDNVASILSYLTPTFLPPPSFISPSLVTTHSHSPMSLSLPAPPQLGWMGSWLGPGKTFSRAGTVGPGGASWGLLQGHASKTRRCCRPTGHRKQPSSPLSGHLQQHWWHSVAAAAAAAVVAASYYCSVALLHVREIKSE